MKQYPSIARDIRHGTPIYAFDKLDGSNIRAEWWKKNGFYKFGRRHGLLDDSSPALTKAEPLFREKYEEDLSRIFVSQRYEQVVAFFEFHGPKSFAGLHEPDDTHTVTVFDLDIYKKGLMEPKPFLDLLEGKVDIAACLYRGNANSELVQAVQEGTLEGMTFEGIVCKGPKDRKTGLPLAFKVKSLAWIEKLKTRCAGNEKLFQELL